MVPPRQQQPRTWWTQRRDRRRRSQICSPWGTTPQHQPPPSKSDSPAAPASPQEPESTKASLRMMAGRGWWMVRLVAVETGRLALERGRLGRGTHQAAKRWVPVPAIPGFQMVLAAQAANTMLRPKTTILLTATSRISRPRRGPRCSQRKGRPSATSRSTWRIRMKGFKKCQSRLVCRSCPWAPWTNSCGSIWRAMVSLQMTIKINKNW